MKQRVSTVITDLDNTLFDWVFIWYQSFNAMLTCLVEESGIEQQVLEADFQRVFQRHGTSEYAFAIEELPSLRVKHPGEDLTKRYASAIHAFNSARKAALVLYPSVLETLEGIKDKGCLVVGYTESMAYYSNYRLRKLGLDRVLDYLYSPPDHDLPPGLEPETIRRYPPESYLLRRTISRHTPKGELKPNPKVLADIIASIGATPEETIYVGDSLMKDIAMAQGTNIRDVWAKYGVAQDRPEYRMLRKVTHWAERDVEREKRTNTGNVQASFVLENSFAEILPLFEFTSFICRSETNQRTVLELWKKTIDVQQHFNDLELRIRNYAMTLLVAVLGAAAFAIKEHLVVKVGNVVIPLAVMLLGAGLVGWLSFYVMDRFGYHRLLYGAVKHGSFIETRFSRVLPEISLTTAIGRESPLRWRKWKLHSTGKMDLFYLGITAMLMLLMVFLAFAGPTGQGGAPEFSKDQNGPGKTAPQHPASGTSAAKTQPQ
jgi:FMN phosphatase YigB (HAD superfamily)